MKLSRRALLGTAAVLPVARARAADAASIKIGVLSDMSGTYRDISGPGSVACAKLAIADFDLGARGLAVELVTADHQNKADIGAGIAREWYDRGGVDLIVGVTNSAVALAVANVAKERNKVCINTEAATSELTGKQCNANTIHWAYDTYMVARSTGAALTKAGGDSWFFITADYAFGHVLQRDTTAIVTAAGGKILGGVTYPFPGTSDFSSFLVQAQASGAKVIGLCNAGADTVNCVKQAREFGLGQTLAGMLMLIQPVHALGLATAHGLVLTESFYWDLNDPARRFSKRLAEHWPTPANMAQAGTYSAVTHYLKAAAAVGASAMASDGAAAVARMKDMPTDDDCFGPGRIRVDGRKIHPSYLFRVKTQDESKGPWDYYTPLATTPADEAFRPLGEGGCRLVKP